MIDSTLSLFTRWYESFLGGVLYYSFAFGSDGLSYTIYKSYIVTKNNTVRCYWLLNDYVTWFHSGSYYYVCVGAYCSLAKHIHLNINHICKEYECQLHIGCFSNWEIKTSGVAWYVETMFGTTYYMYIWLVERSHKCVRGQRIKWVTCILYGYTKTPPTHCFYPLQMNQTLYYMPWLTDTTHLSPLPSQFDNLPFRIFILLKGFIYTKRSTVASITYYMCCLVQCHRPEHDIGWLFNQ